MSEDLTKITAYDSIIKYVSNIKEKGLEIEARLGKIVYKVTDNRVSWSVNHPVIFEKLPIDYRFENGVEKADFDKLNSDMGKSGSDSLIGGNKSYKTDPIPDTIIIGKSNKRKITRNDETKYQTKHKISDITIFMPKYKYDLRISVCKENDLDSQPEHFVPQIIRERLRYSYTVDDLVYDFTKIKAGKWESKDKYEVEVEGTSGGFDISTFVDTILNIKL